MSIEIRYIYGGYQINETGIKRTARNASEIDRITDSFYGYMDDPQDHYLVLDNRHFTGYTKKQLLVLEQSIIKCITIAKQCGLDLTVVMRRDLRTEIRPTAGLLSKVIPMEYHTIVMEYPHVDLGKKIVMPISEKVLRLADTVAVGIGDSWQAIRHAGKSIDTQLVPFLHAGTVAQLGDLHPMESSSVEVVHGCVHYRFVDLNKRVWLLIVPAFYVDYDEAMAMIKKDAASKRYLDMFYNSTPDPVRRISDEVLNMLLPWSYRVGTSPARGERVTDVTFDESAEQNLA